MVELEGKTRRTDEKKIIVCYGLRAVATWKNRSSFRIAFSWVKEIIKKLCVHGGK